MKGKNEIYNRYIKRVLDIICALLALTVTGPLYIVVAILVKIKLGSPVIFTQKRPGKNEKIFKMYKFRTMTDARDENGKLLPDEKRLTSFGKFLRSTSLDELPEAINILKGDMSVIGPRPQLVRDMVFMTPEQRQRHSVKPGLSGLAQVSGRNALDWEEKLEIDLEYIKDISLKNDARIVGLTVKKVFFRDAGPDNIADNTDLAEDYGDYLLNLGKISRQFYEEKQMEAKRILGE